MRGAGGLHADGAAARARAGPAAAEAQAEAAAKSFYLQEMERYKQMACDTGKDGAARPMVK